MRNIVQIIIQFCLLAVAVYPVLSTPLLLAGEPSVQRPVEQLNSRRAYGYLRKICRIGRRVSGSRGMQIQRQQLEKHFTKLGAAVTLQTFDVTHPLHGTPVRMANMIVSWHPKSTKRVLIACHYDTRPFPDQDRVNPKGRFIGANDGASGVALLMELGHVMQEIKPTYGVDFVFFDGEELVYGKQGKYFHGSEYFAKSYRDLKPNHEYLYGVLVDMVGDRHLQIYQEKNSMKYARPLVESIWDTAKELKIRAFVPQVKYEINDDHLALNQIAQIPTCDLIDFDYRYWHTTQDLPTKCSGSSLVQVGRVLQKWLQQVPAPVAR